MDTNLAIKICGDFNTVNPRLVNAMQVASKTHNTIEMHQNDIIKLQTKKSAKEFEIELNDMSHLILNMASKQIRDVARQHFEKIVTDALQFVTQDTNYKFIIEDKTDAKKPSYEFYIESLVNGKVCRQKPEDACGGGFIDIISVTAKYAYREIFKDPEIMNAATLLDEPGKMVSELMSVKFAEFIRFLGKKFGKQTIMVTHKDTIANVADLTLYVRKDRQGVSKVAINNPSGFDKLIDMVDDELQNEWSDKVDE